MRITELSLHDKRVLIRVDFNVPMTKEGTIRDDTRIRAALPTIEYAIKEGAKVILISHLGRPKGKQEALSLWPCAKRLGELLEQDVRFIEDCVGSEVETAISEMKNGDVALLENVRFYEAEEHPEKDPRFVEQLSRLGTCYVNDAFGTAHRAHASTTLIAKYFPKQSAAGFLLIKEIEAMSKLFDPSRPFVAILGGAKISTKLPIILSLLDKVDSLLIGGAMAYTFMKALSISVGDSPVEDGMLAAARDVLQKAKELNKRVLLPCDLIVASEYSNDAESICVDGGIPEKMQGMDIGPKTIEEWTPLIQEAKTIFWNGPVGVFEFSRFSTGTTAIAEIIGKCPDAFSVVGGGDSIAAIEQSGEGESISHISTGGGASLECIEKGSLPGIDALEMT